jgi:DNA mismatch endonuclease (patch repair protein)
MVDIVDQATRSKMMAGIKSKNTKPELAIRRGLFARGLRFRLHPKELPGKPDLVFPKYKTVLFVHGCFWHAHNCHLFRIPSSNQEYWHKKLIGNRDRDQIQQGQLKQAGWRVLIVFECELRGQSALVIENLLNNLAMQIRLGNPPINNRS